MELTLTQSRKTQPIKGNETMAVNNRLLTLADILAIEGMRRVNATEDSSNPT